MVVYKDNKLPPANNNERANRKKRKAKGLFRLQSFLNKPALMPLFQKAFAFEQGGHFGLHFARF